MYNSDIEKLPEYLLALQKAGADALLISDLGVWQTARRVVPGMPLHVSTQANTTNWASVQAWQDLGAERVVLARELSLEEIAQIGAKTSVELEAFVHGAMCISYSGRTATAAHVRRHAAGNTPCTKRTAPAKATILKKTRTAPM